MRARLWILCLTLLLLFPLAAHAQDISFYWESWNASINVSEADQTLTIAESQAFVLESGSIRRGSRSWLDPVTVNTVYLNTPDGELVELTRASSGETPGTYTLEQEGDETLLRYYFPEPVNGGDSFLIQLNYTAPLFTENLVDWYVIPENHGAPVNNSVVQINFLDADPPSEGLVRVISNNGVVSVQGRTVSIMTPNGLDADEPLYIQMPFGANVGAATNNQSGGVEPLPTTARTPAQPRAKSEALGISLDSLLPILCIVIVVIIIITRGGGGLGGIIGALLNMFLSGRSGGGSDGGIFPGGGSSGGSSGGSTRRPSTPSGGSSSGGGFRRSGNQTRNVPSVRNRKGGGSAGLG